MVNPLAILLAAMLLAILLARYSIGRYAVGSELPDQCLVYRYKQVCYVGHNT
jgi:hypothetical protein